MIKLLYGTTNLAKLSSMKHMLKGLNLEIINNPHIDFSHIKIEENGKTPIENARIKALAFYKEFKIPVFSCDSGLYFKNADDKYQPGVTVRRVSGKHLNDEEMIEYYSALAKKHGGKLISYYQNAISLVMNENEIYSYDGDLVSEEFIITSVPHKKRTEGFPLDSLSVHIGTGKYYMDIKSDSTLTYLLKKDLSIGLCNFFITNVNGVRRI